MINVKEQDGIIYGITGTQSALEAALGVDLYNGAIVTIDGFDYIACFEARIDSVTLTALAT